MISVSVLIVVRNGFLGEEAVHERRVAERREVPDQGTRICTRPTETTSQSGSRSDARVLNAQPLEKIYDTGRQQEERKYLL